jgi:hypothetical protein
MIPGAPILRRALRRSFLSDSHYSPYFLINSNAHRLRPAEPGDTPGSLEFHLTEVHEGSHWFQHVGTTFGAFMDALRSSQRYTLLRFMRDEPRAKRARIVRARLDRGQPFIKLDPRNQYVKIDDKDAHNSIGLLKQIWFDHQWLHASLDDSRSTNGLGHPPPEACGAVMADVILNCCDTFNFVSDDYRTAGHRNAREWYFAGDASLSEVLVNLEGSPHHLTSTGLMECAASLNELQQARSGMLAVVLGETYQTRITNQVEAFLKSTYSLPSKMFALVAPKYADDWQRGAVALNLVIYLALNPPLPPRVLSMPRRSYRWHEIYPPHRFIVALRTLKDVPPLDDPDSVSAMQRFLSALVEASSLPYAGATPMPQRSEPEVHWESCSEVDDYHLTIDDELVIQAQLHIEKIPNYLALLANYSSCLSGPLSREFSGLLLRHEARFNFMNPPLEFLEDGRLGFRGSKAFGNNVVRSVAISHAMFELACGSGAMTLDQLPSEVRESRQMIEFMHHTIYKMIVETDNLP